MNLESEKMVLSKAFLQNDFVSQTSLSSFSQLKGPDVCQFENHIKSVENHVSIRKPHLKKKKHIKTTLSSVHDQAA